VPAALAQAEMREQEEGDVYKFYLIIGDRTKDI